MLGRVLHSTPPLHGGAITQIEPGITSSDGYFKPRFALDGDYDSLRAYKRAMLQKYGSEKWQELQEKAEAMQKRLTGVEGRLQQGESDLEKVAGLRLWRRSVAALKPEVLDIITMKARLGEAGWVPAISQRGRVPDMPGDVPHPDRGHGHHPELSYGIRRLAFITEFG